MLIFHTGVCADKMASLTVASKANQASTLPILLVAQYAKERDPNASIEIVFSDVEELLEAKKAVVIFKSASAPGKPLYKDIVHTVMHEYPNLQGKHDSIVREWIDRANGFVPTDFKSVEGPLLELDSHLTLRSFVVGYSLTPADLAVWGAVRGNKVAYAAVKKGAMLNVTRWFKFIEETSTWIAPAVQSLNAHAQERKVAKSKEGANYDIALPDTDKGVVTRFPPEPS